MYTAIFCEGYTVIVDMLLSRGAIVNQPTKDDGLIALQIVAAKGQAAVVWFLLAAGAKIWDESQGLPDVVGGLPWGAVVGMMRSIDTSL
jgi:ankyrin repeat protein